MHLSKKLLITSLAMIVGCGSMMIVPAVAASADDLILMCYRGQTIQIPFYLQTRYIAKGAVNGACGASAL